MKGGGREGTFHCWCFFVTILTTHRRDIGWNQSDRHTECTALPHTLPSCPIQTSQRCQHEVQAPSCFKWHLTWCLCGVSARTFTLHITLPVPMSVWSGYTAITGPEEQLRVFKQSVHDDLQTCDETSGGKCKVNSRFTGVWFTSLNCFPPSRALPPSGKCISKSTCWNLKRQMNFKCFKGRHKTEFGCNSSLPTGTANTTGNRQYLQRLLFGKSKD